MTMDYKLILDLMVAALLLVTIVYAWILNQRLGQLRRNRDDLAKVVSSFNEATARAEAGIPKMRKAADESGQALPRASSSSTNGSSRETRLTSVTKSGKNRKTKSTE